MSDLGDRDVLVWWARLDVAPDLMDDAERGRHDRFRREADQRRLRVGSALLRLAAADVLGGDPREVRIDRTCSCGAPHGKPRIVVDADSGVPAPEVSVSHSGDWVVLAMTRGAAVGVDVEEHRQNLDVAGLARTVLTADELADGGGRDVDAFLAHWTCKEAVLKATGDGLTVPLTQLTIADAPTAPRLARWEGRPAPAMWLTRLAPRPTHSAALAVLDPEPRSVTELDAAPLLARA